MSASAVEHLWKRRTPDQLQAIRRRMESGRPWTLEVEVDPGRWVTVARAGSRAQLRQTSEAFCDRLRTVSHCGSLVVTRPPKPLVVVSSRRAIQ